MIEIVRAGDYEGQRVDEAVLTGDQGMRLHFLNWGVTLRDWRVRVGDHMRPVVLGFDSFDPYPEYSPYFGAIAGRVANRIRDARFELDGKTYQLDRNHGDHHLHGGTKGLTQRIWSMEPDSAHNALRFSTVSEDGEMGYPGRVEFSVLYRLDGNRLVLDIEGRPDRPTPINVVQHHYFNLGLSETVQDHMVYLPFGHKRTVSDKDLIPTGEIADVNGTDWDFTQPHTLRRADGQPRAFDGNLVLEEGRDKDQPVAIVSGEDGALTLKLWTDRPGLQLYDGVWTDCAVPGLDGRRYGQFSGLCLEDQMFADAVHHPHFPSIICTPDKPYRHHCVIEIAGR